MTTNQSTILVSNPHTKKAMAVLAKFAALETQYKAMEVEVKEATELIKEAMIAGGVEKITIDVPGWAGYITLAERTTYGADDISEVAPEYTKAALDTAKVKAQAVLTGELPAGVTESKTTYITKKLKEVS